MHRVLVLSPEPLRARLAGPSIRAVELAKALANVADVTIGSPKIEGFESELPTLQVVPGQVKLAVATIKEFDVVVAQQLPLVLLEQLADLPVRLVFDWYDPLPLEVLELFKNETLAAQQRQQTSTLIDLQGQAMSADLLLCASPKQRDLWIGALMAWGELLPERVAADPTADSMLAVVPFGVADRFPKVNEGAIKGKFKGIGKDDKVILWGGGIWEWLDALTVVQAVEKLAKRRRDVRLFFMGTKRPKGGAAAGNHALEEVVSYAERQKLVGKHVFFNDDWVPYDDRHQYLADADLGVTAHHDHLETQFSFRTRVLDYFWAGLPVVTTDGDSFADLVITERLGAVTACGDAEAMAGALERLIDENARTAEIRRNVADVAKHFHWQQVAAPLRQFVQQPPAARRRNAAALRRMAGLQRRRHLSELYQQEGLGAVARRAARKPWNKLRRR